MRFIDVSWGKTNPTDYRSAIKMTAISFKGKVFKILSGIGVFKVLEKLLSASNGIFLVHFSRSNITPDQRHAKYFEFSKLPVDPKSTPV